MSGYCFWILCTAIEYSGAGIYMAVRCTAMAARARVYEATIRRTFSAAYFAQRCKAASNGFRSAYKEISWRRAPVGAAYPLMTRWSSCAAFFFFDFVWMLFICILVCIYENLLDGIDWNWERNKCNKARHIRLNLWTIIRNLLASSDGYDYSWFQFRFVKKKETL